MPGYKMMSQAADVVVVGGQDYPAASDFLKHPARWALHLPKTPARARTSRSSATRRSRHRWITPGRLASPTWRRLKRYWGPGGQGGHRPGAGGSRCTTRSTSTSCPSASRVTCSVRSGTSSSTRPR